MILILHGTGPCNEKVGVRLLFLETLVYLKRVIKMTFEIPIPRILINSKTSGFSTYFFFSLTKLSFLKNFIYLFIYLFMVVLGLRFCVRAFSSCGKRGPLLIVVRRPLTIAASLVAEHRLQTRRLSNCGSRAQLLRSMWDLPRPGLEPVSRALAGRFSTTAPPGKPLVYTFDQWSPTF